MNWRDALMKLHVRGWDTDDIELAVESLCEACSDGAFEGTQVLDLQDHGVRLVLEVELPEDEIRALLVLADLRFREGDEVRELQRALYDLDAFAYEYAGDD